VRRDIVEVYLYLALTSGRNRLRAQLRRLRQPRYALGLVLGVGYIWFFLIHQSGFRTQRPGGGIFAAEGVELLASFGVFILFMRWWLFGNERWALAFTPAEVQFLFAAPLSRRSLIQFKLMRAQVAILFNAVLLTFIFGRGGTALPPLLRVLSLWALFSIFMMHRLGATLVRSATVEHGKAGAKRNVVALTLFSAVAIGLLWGIIDIYPVLRTAPSPRAAIEIIGGALREPIPNAVLAPFRVLLAPSFATSVGDWARVFPLVLIGLVLHYLWVIRTDAAFEDAAVAASLERARRIEAHRARRGGAGGPLGATGKRSWIPLRATGHPAVAIVWKNLVSLTRTGSAVRAGISLAIVIATVVFTVGSDRSAPLGGVIAITALFAALALVVIGARFVRIDLRHDLLHLGLLRTYPLSGTTIVAAEIAGPTVILTVLQLALLLVGAGALPDARVDSMTRLLILLTAPLVLLVLNATTVMLQNAAALMFPAWVKLGAGPSAGVELLGQNLLMMVGSLIALALALVPPIILAGLAYFGIAAVAPEAFGLAIGGATMAGLLTLGAEVVMSVRMLGRLFERGEGAAK
jgi:hypothetical protein